MMLSKATALLKITVMMQRDPESSNKFMLSRSGVR